MSLHTEMLLRALRMLIAISRSSSRDGKITSRSTSLHSFAVPRAQEPNRITCNGSKRSTIRSTIAEMT